MAPIYEPVSVDYETARMLVDSMRFYDRVGPDGWNGCCLRHFDRRGCGGARGRQASSELEMAVYPWSERRPALYWNWRGGTEGLACPIIAVVRTVRIVGCRLVVTGRERIADAREASWSCPIPDMPETARRTGQTTLEAFRWCPPPSTASSPRSSASIW